MVVSMSREDGKRKFLDMVEEVNNHNTVVKEYLLQPLTYKENVMSILNREKHGTLIWQHTNAFHAVCIYVEAGKGYRFNRAGLDLYSVMENNGINMRDKEEVRACFDVVWNKANDNQNYGVFPKTKSSATTRERRKLASYIVADLDKGENPKSRIPSLPINAVDRTHLVPVTITGIENNKAVVILFDAYLNQNTLKNFEDRMLEVIQKQDVIWWVVIQKTADGLLEWNYIICDSQGNLIDSLRVVDDRWFYYWWYDESYQSINW